MTRDPENPADPSAAYGRAPPLYRKAFRILAAEIRDRTLPEGARLTEQPLADRFGISRAPVRQAMALLAQHGLIARLPGRGFAVTADGADRASLLAPGRAQRAGAPLQSLASWEQIYGEVESEIVARIAFGTWRLREAELARHYRVSRTVARDVVGRLQSRGLVEKGDAGRWYAPGLTPERLGELYELRAVLEPLALGKAAPHIPPAALAAARARLLAAIDQPHAVTGERLDALEEDLHVTLLGYGRNRTLLQTIRQHHSLLVAHRFLYRWTPRLFPTEPFLPEHLAVLDRLAAGDAAAAAAALERHLRLSLDRAIARVDDVSTMPRPGDICYLQRM